MLRHHALARVLLRFAQHDINLGREQTGELHHPTSEARRHYRENILFTGEYLMDRDMASVTMRSALLGAVRNSGMYAIQSTHVV